MKLKDQLKAKGWTDEQIAAALADPNVVTALDDVFGTLTSERDRMKQLNDEWQNKLDTEYNPRMAKAEEEAAKARRESADLREQLNIARDYGYLESDEAKRRAEAAAADAARRNDPGAYDPKRHPTYEDVSRFAEAEAQAIAMMTDTAQEYAHLTGKQLFDYEAQVNGRMMRGATALREEAKLARKDFYQFVSEKFDFSGLRRQRQENLQKEHDEKIRKEAGDAVRREMAEKYSNPNLAMPQASYRPLLPARSSGEAKQPWERGTAQERKAERIQRAVQAQITSQVN